MRGGAACRLGLLVFHCHEERQSPAEPTSTDMSGDRRGGLNRVEHINSAAPPSSFLYLILLFCPTSLSISSISPRSLCLNSPFPISIDMGRKEEINSEKQVRSWTAVKTSAPLSCPLSKLTWPFYEAIKTNNYTFCVLARSLLFSSFHCSLQNSL